MNSYVYKGIEIELSITNGHITYYKLYDTGIIYEEGALEDVPVTLLDALLSDIYDDIDTRKDMK